jgi:NAD(P)-dependent dehydrogenase (short-subunit alcohol dehydrogenase family)
VEGLTETLRFELLAAGISVMLVEPGAYDTSFQRNIRESRGFTAEHPLRGMFKSYSEAMNSALYAGDPPDPQEVADAVIEAIDHPTGPFRRLVGKDAEMIGKLKREHSFEEFAEAIRTTLDVDLRTDSTAQQPVGS